MGMSIRTKRALIVSAFAATAAIAPAVPAAAAAAIPCPFGYVCMALPQGTIIAVPEGQSKTFPGGVTMAGITNQTKISYCVNGSLNFALGAGAEVIRTQTVTSFGPGTICLA